MSKKLSSIIVLIISALIFLGCETTPDPVDTDDVVDGSLSGSTDQVDGVNFTAKTGPITEEEFLLVEAEILKAEEAYASEFAPQRLEESKSFLAESRELNDDGTHVDARLKLQSAYLNAKNAYTDSVLKAEARYRSRLDEADKKAVDAGAPEIYPGEYASAKDLSEKSKALFDEKNYSEGRVQAEKALSAYDDITQRSTNAQAQIESLQIEVEGRLAEAEDQEAYIWAPDVLNQANESYFNALRAYRDGNLSKTLEYLTQARYLAQLAIKAAKDQMASKQTQDLMLEVMRRIEAASRMTIVDDEDNILLPDPWEGETFLDSDLEQEPEGESLEPTSFLLPNNGQTLVLGDLDRISALEKAKELWVTGVQERNEGNFDMANEYFLESLKYLDVYEQQAVDQFYTVRLIPERRDSLWRIAEYAEIYGDPFAWPRIWRRNRRQVQNPDLIYPGWKLIIPPQ